MVVGIGQIGSLIALALASEADYEVVIVDSNMDSPSVDRLSQSPLGETILAEEVSVHYIMEMDRVVVKHKPAVLISCLPHNLTYQVADLAHRHGISYFDLTEDVHTTQRIKALVEKVNLEEAPSVFVPQCGVAPGYISIAANHLMSKFGSVRNVKLRVGALPQSSTNALHYACTWSPEGLVNEYCHPCDAIVNSRKASVEPLEGLETLEVGGHRYEAFNTSGGLGGLSELHFGSVHNMDYKTIRYPGHCAIMKTLCNDLELRNRKILLVNILKGAIPKTEDDKVLIHISVDGISNDEFVEKTITKEIRPIEAYGYRWSAIQAATAFGLLSVMDVVLKNKEYNGFVHQEDVSLEEFSNSRFSWVYYGLKK
jgi:saccharopine dehydrogenase-like NADP-dependent oxidoreductase